MQKKMENSKIGKQDNSVGIHTLAHRIGKYYNMGFLKARTNNTKMLANIIMIQIRNKKKHKVLKRFNNGIIILI